MRNMNETKKRGELSMKNLTFTKLMKRVTTLSLAGVLAVTALTACGSNSGSDSSESSESEESNEVEVQTIVVGAPSLADKWGNLDENGELDGYEIAVLKAIDEKLPQYEFEIQPSDFQDILLSLDSGKIDLGTHMFEYNEERAEKYLYGEEGYINFSTYFIIPADSEDTTWDSLSGKIVGVLSETETTASLIKSYNEENPDKALELDYYGSIGEEAVIQSLLEGRWDAIDGLAWEADEYNEEYGNGEEIVKRGDAIGTSLSYYLYPDDGEHEELKTAVDEVLKELREDGTLAEISNQYFGYDVTPAE